MTQFEFKILDEFFKLYKKRVINNSSIGKNKIKIHILYDKTEWYFNNKDLYNAAIDNLEKKGIIKVKRNVFNEPLEIRLIDPSNLPSIVNYDDYPSIEPLIARCSLSKSKIVNSFLDKLKQLVFNNGSIKQFLHNGSFDDDWLKAVDGVEALEKMVSHNINSSLRDFSKAIFNDSKMIYKYMPKMKKICNFSNDDNSFLEYYGIVKTQFCMKIRGNVKFFIGENTQIDLKEGSVWGLPLNVDLSKNKGLKILSIENFTTFFDVDTLDYDVIIYLGGFPNKEKLDFIFKLGSNNQIYHWGDIDVGGFQILLLLRENGINVKSINMDISFIEKNIDFFMPIDSSKSQVPVDYLDNLNKLLSNNKLQNDELESINYILKNKIWLEQESFYASILLEKLKKIS